MTMRYRNIMRAVSETPWAIHPEKAADMLAFLAFKAGGGDLSPDDIQAVVGAADPVPRRTDAGGGIAVLRLRGVIAHHIEQVDDISGPGGTAVERFRMRFREALADASVSAIVLDIDSPGGAVDGVEELATEIFQSRGAKPIVAVANTQAASAAYWLAAAADEISVTPSGEVGSIGVFAAHREFSQFEEKMGVKTTLVSAGKYKVEGNPFEPLSEEAREYLQARVDDYYDAFTKSVARARGVKLADVRNGFGQGRMAGARDAVAAGMADRVETLEDTIRRLQRPAGKGRARAQAESPADPHLIDDFAFL